jgi:site-specific recombinase XerD
MTRVRDRGVGHRLEGDAEEGGLLAQANAFLDALAARGLARDTIRSYAFDLVILFRWMHRDRVDVLGLEDQLLAFIQFQKTAGAQPRSINRRLVTSEQFYRFVTGQELGSGRLPRPPTHYKGRGRDRALGLHVLRRPHRRKLRLSLPRRVVEPLGTAQVAAFLRSLRRYRDLAIVHLMLFCGLRSGEVLSLRLSDIHWDEHRLRVRGKGNRERVLPLAQMLASVLADYLRLERPSAKRTDAVFLVLQGRRRGEPMTRTGLRSLFRHRRRSKKLLGNANAHRFRHTFGADMARAGVRLPVLQRLMGHADGMTTLQYINLSMIDIAQEYARAIDAIEKRYVPR